MDPITVNSLNELDSAAAIVINNLESSRIVCLYGGMGAGKTTFIKSLCKVLGVHDNVVSPTFALINEYSTPQGDPIYHFDFYRIEKLEEVYDFGYEEYFYSNHGVCFIEWPELIEEILPNQGVIRLSITAEPNGSRIIKKI